MPMIEEFDKAGNFLFRWRSYLPLLFFAVIFMALGNFHYPYGRHDIDLMWEVLCLFIGALGLTTRIITVGFVTSGTSGRGTAKPSASRLNTTGMYSVVRNPLYLGNFFTYLAPILFVRSWSVAGVFVLAFILYYERIIFAEEVFLRNKFGNEFIEWASKTPAFFPNYFKWNKPDLPFSWKMALSREYHGVYGLVCVMFFWETLTDLYINDGLMFDTFWKCTFTITTLFYLVVRFLDKKTHFLAISDR